MTLLALQYVKEVDGMAYPPLNSLQEQQLIFCYSSKGIGMSQNESDDAIEIEIPLEKFSHMFLWIYI